MEYIKRTLLYMFRKPLDKGYSSKTAVQQNESTKLPDSDYDGMGNFSRFGRP
jgi:hypothetical protein